jgi:hypothetical protein
MATFINFGTKECPKLVNEERIISVEYTPKGGMWLESYTIRYGFTTNDNASITILKQTDEAGFKKVKEWVDSKQA